MNIDTKLIDTYTVNARIMLDAKDCEEYVAIAKKQIADAVTIEGFRKGKAPQHLVDQQIKPEAIRAEALELALEGSFSSAVKQKDWDVLRTSDLKVERNDASGLEYRVQVSLWPVVTIPELASVHVERTAIAVNDTEVDDALDTVRNMRATFIDKTEPSITGDRVEVDFDASIDGKSLEGGSSRNHPLIIGGASFMPGFEEQLIGLAAGQTKQFSIVAPDDYYEPKVAGKKVDFSVTVHKVQSVLKPVADDVFAKSLGNFSTIEQLRDNLRGGLIHEKESKEKQRVRQSILDGIIKNASVPAPEYMVNDELSDMIQRFGHDLHHKGIELAMYLARMKKTEDDLKHDWKQEAEHQVRMTLVLRAIAKQQKIAVSSEELDAALREVVAGMAKQGQATGDQVDPLRIRTMLHERMLTDRTLEFLERTCS